MCISNRPILIGTRRGEFNSNKLQYPPCTPSLFTISGTALKESVDLDILGVTVNSKMTFEKHLRLVDRASSQRLAKYLEEVLASIS